MTGEAAVRRALRDRRSDEPTRLWLSRLLNTLSRVPSPSLVDDLADTLRGGLGDEHRHLEDDPDAHLAFWRDVSARYPEVPRLRALYADTLLLTGHKEAALDEFLAAFAADPRLLYAFSGELRDFFESRGGRAWALYRVVVIKAAELDDPQTHSGYINEQREELMAVVRANPDYAAAVLAVLRSPSGSPGTERDAES
ncbi:hypothetical protein [Streptomyces sp. NBC_00038]|uniref:hypothetical protein n=1 Tax=Streptomyces sp. NBC_00038 TaxID=2903615 RepID=UPI002256407A|nr:hypothetical protein [Streptomyces sp. NBC_00038]MCX5557530.1 hypothetical protein [Streptomyces sp. NBC_00038]